MKRIMVNVLAVVCLFAVSACSGDSSPAMVEQITCPDGSKVAASCGAGKCPTVELVAGATTYSNVDPREIIQSGISIKFSGELDPNSVRDDEYGVELHKGSTVLGQPAYGAVSFSSGNTIVTFVPTQLLAYGQMYNLNDIVNDSVGRLVQSNIQFKTADMLCTGSEWSTPALFSTSLQTCVAGIGVQTQIAPMYNTLQDGTCKITIGSLLTPECKAYMANGTMVLANTGVVVGGHPMMWMTYIPISEPRNIVLLDVSDQANPVPVFIFTLSPSLVWATGNLSGLRIHTSNGGESQLTVNSSSQIVSTCILGCQ